jgi:hypothetical protein
VTAPVPAGPTDAQAELREAWARKLFHEFVTGLPSAWTSDHGQNAHYRAECYRVVDELLAAVRAALEAQETVRRDAVVRATLAVEAMRPHIPPSNDPERRTAVIVRSTLNRAARVVRATLDGDR